MRRIPSLLSQAHWTVFLLTAGPHALTAQIAVDVALGVRRTSPLVRDSIVVPIEVRATLGPVIGVTVGAPLRSGWSADATLDVSRTALRRVETATADAELGAVYTVTGGVSLNRALQGGVVARVGIGAVRHIAAARWIFRRGAPGVTAIGWAAVRFDPPLGPRRLTLEARYDFHRFTTPALEEVGFTSARAVHRVAVLLRARVHGGGP